MENFKAIRDFREAWARNDLGDVRQTGRFRIWAKVSYHSPKIDEQDRTHVTIHFDGYDQGAIDIEETSDLSAQDFHLRFTTDWQQYTFDSDNDTLVVEGSSEKMGGEYMVRIHPRVSA